MSMHEISFFCQSIVQNVQFRFTSIKKIDKNSFQLFTSIHEQTLGLVILKKIKWKLRKSRLLPTRAHINLKKK